MTPALTAALQLPVLSADETTRLLEAAKSGDGAARDRIVLHSLRFVVLRMRVWCAWLDRVTGDQAREDALLEGVEGLYDAIDHYDVTRGAWTTCAVWWIDDRLRDFAWDEISLVRIPNKRRKSAHRLEVAQLLHSVRLDDVGHPDGDKARGTRLDAQAAPPDAPDEQQAQSAAAQAVDELLARLDDEQLETRFDDGTISPAMERKAIATAVKQTARATQVLDAVEHRSARQRRRVGELAARHLAASV